MGSLYLGGWSVVSSWKKTCILDKIGGQFGLSSVFWYGRFRRVHDCQWCLNIQETELLTVADCVNILVGLTMFPEQQDETVRFYRIEGHVLFIRPASNQFKISSEWCRCSLPHSWMGYCMTQCGVFCKNEEGYSRVSKHLFYLYKKQDCVQDTTIRYANHQYESKWRGLNE